MPFATPAFGRGPARFTVTTMKRTPPVHPPVLLDVHDLAHLLNRSVPSLRRDDARGRIPEAVRIGGSKRWRRQEVLEWIHASCPPRAAWTYTDRSPRHPANDPATPVG
jgi:predicted DNA-binding transcriptional regulator AlpA